MQPELAAQGVDFTELEAELRSLARELLQAGATQVKRFKITGLTALSCLSNAPQPRYGPSRVSRGVFGGRILTASRNS